MLSDFDAFQTHVLRKALIVHLAQIKGEIACGKRTALDVGILQSHAEVTKEMLDIIDDKKQSKLEVRSRTLQIAADTFDRYAVNHWLKGAEEKAKANEELAKMCKEALK